MITGLTCTMKIPNSSDLLETQQKPAVAKRGIGEAPQQVAPRILICRG